ncbi:MAG: sigma-54-dependent Fis family transcriptional regulator [Chitinophagales bacterium]|nr:sigma-54-dependent Fis family transcriptional regulator [Chitinophagales bacterium]
MLHHYLSLNPDYEVTVFNDEQSFFAQLHNKPDVVTLDYSLPKQTGEEVLKKIKHDSPDTDVLVVSGQEDVGTAVSLLQAGAADYIVKNEDTKDILWNVIIRLQQIKSLKTEVSELKSQLKHRYDINKMIIGQSDAMQKVFQLIEKAAQTNITVSITGETGTGKEMVAKAIHHNSSRQQYPFVALNVAAIPRDLLESELFGHEKGAFTGATGKRLGKFEEAHKGTLFLDEIGEMDLTLQAKLLRVLQEREITRIGSNTVVPIDVRIIVATHRNLTEEVKAKRFREDLYYRLLGLPISIPPLRERGNDIIVLAKHFLQQFCKDNQLPEKTCSTAAFDKLRNYSFPGNVRELKSIVELAAVMADGSNIEADNLTLFNNNKEADLLQEEMTLRDYERKIIQHYLEKYDYDILLVAKKLDIGKSTLYRMVQAGEIILKK